MVGLPDLCGLSPAAMIASHCRGPSSDSHDLLAMREAESQFPVPSWCPGHRGDDLDSAGTGAVHARQKSGRNLQHGHDCRADERFRTVPLPEQRPDLACRRVLSRLRSRSAGCGVCADARRSRLGAHGSPGAAGPDSGDAVARQAHAGDVVDTHRRGRAQCVRQQRTDRSAAAGADQCAPSSRRLRC